MTALRTAAPAHAAPYAPARASIDSLGPFRKANLWVTRKRNLGDYKANLHEALWEWECFPERFNLAVTEQATADTPMPLDFYPLHCQLVERGYGSILTRDEIILHARVYGSLHGCDSVDPEDLDALEATLPDAWDPPWLPGQESGFVGEWIITETDSSVATLEPPAEPELLTKPSYWLDGKLWWRIGGRHISDADLRSWCYQHMPYPWNHVDVVRKCHVDAWAQAHGVALDAAISATPDDAAVA